MQRDQKLVINIILLTLIFISYSSAQKIEDKYKLVTKIIERTTKENKNEYKLRERPLLTDALKKYYNYKYNNKAIYTVMKESSKKEDSIINISNKTIWSKKYKLIDSLFNKKDIEHILHQIKNKRKSNDINIWESQKITYPIKIIENKVMAGCNSISSPYYSLNGKFALLEHNSLKTFTTLYIFKKKKKRWILLGTIDNIWY